MFRERVLKKGVKESTYEPSIQHMWGVNDYELKYAHFVSEPAFPLEGPFEIATK
jgi:hypothetical protein